MKKPVHTLVVGDRVTYTAAFLRSCGIYAGAPAHRAGRVEALVGPALVRVQWEDSPSFSIVFAQNLVALQNLHREPS